MRAGLEGIVLSVSENRISQSVLSPTHGIRSARQVCQNMANKVPGGCIMEATNDCQRPVDLNTLVVLSSNSKSQ